MSDFYKTRMGARFYDRTMPDLVRQLERLNGNLERLIEQRNEKADTDEA